MLGSLPQFHRRCSFIDVAQDSFDASLEVPPCHGSAKSHLLLLPPRKQRQIMIPDVFWATARALCETSSVAEVAKRLKCTRQKVYHALYNNVSPSERVRGKPNGVSRSSVYKKGVYRRRLAVRQLITKKALIVAKKVMKQRGRPRKDGVPRKTYVVEKKFCKARFPSPAAVARELGARGIRVGLSTVRRDLLSLGLKAYRRRPACALTPAEVKTRERFCKATLRKSKQWFNSLVFSDEKWFDANDHGDTHEWLPKGRRQQCTVREHIQSPPKVLVWACIGVNFRKLVVVNFEGPGLTSPEYCNQCLGQLSRGDMKGRVLMQDGAKIHWTDEVKEFAKSVLRVPLLAGWPSHSADLNPIEHLWSMVSRRVAQRGPFGKEELTAYVTEEFERVSTDVVNNLVVSFRRRCEECVKVGGAQVQ